MARLRKPEKNWPLRIFFVLLVLVAIGGAAARATLTLIPPHVASQPNANLADDKKKQLSDALDDQIPSDREQCIDFALDFTDRSLSPSFGFGSGTSFDFGTKARRANAAEYASLFASVFDAAAKRAGSTALAYRVRSTVRVFGKKVPLPAFAEHDWVEVVDPADGAHLYIDPLFADLWLGASLARSVKGGDGIVLQR